MTHSNITLTYQYHKLWEQMQHCNPTCSTQMKASLVSLGAGGTFVFFLCPPLSFEKLSTCCFTVLSFYKLVFRLVQNRFGQTAVRVTMCSQWSFVIWPADVEEIMFMVSESQSSWILSFFRCFKRNFNKELKIVVLRGQIFGCDAFVD